MAAEIDKQMELIFHNLNEDKKLIEEVKNVVNRVKEGHLNLQIKNTTSNSSLNELKDMEVKDFVNDSMIQIKYMSKTLTDFRNFLKPSTKKQLFSISKALTEINEIIGKQVFYSNIQMSFNYKNENEELLIYGYENEFKQVLLNLLNNAKNKIVEKNVVLLIAH